MLKTNEPPLGLDPNLSEQGAVTFEELPGNTVNFQHCWARGVKVPDEHLQLYCYLLFSSFHSHSPAEIQTLPARCWANTQQEKNLCLQRQRNDLLRNAPLPVIPGGAPGAERRRGAGAGARRGRRAGVPAPAPTLPCAAAPQAFPRGLGASDTALGEASPAHRPECGIQRGV